MSSSMMNYQMNTHFMLPSSHNSEHSLRCLRETVVLPHSSVPRLSLRTSNVLKPTPLEKKNAAFVEMEKKLLHCSTPVLLSTLLFSEPASASPPMSALTYYTPQLSTTDASNPVFGETSALLEASVQFLYLGGLLALLGFGSFLVVRQILVKRELENAAKELQDRVRTGEASSEECFELGAVMLRKKFFIQAKSYLGQAINKWDGEEQDLAQVYNALGFTYFSEENMDKALEHYEKAIQLSPGYVIAWNNIGNTRERKKEWEKALKAYETALSYDPSNKVASERAASLRVKVERFKGVPTSQSQKS